MLKLNVDQNYYGMESFRNSPLSEKTKLKLSCLLLLHPNITAIEALIISQDYLSEVHAERLMTRLQKQIEEYNPIDFMFDFLDKIDDWIAVHGFLSFIEIEEIIEKVGLPRSHYMHRLWKAFNELESIDKESIISFLTYYSTRLNQEQIDSLLDKYLEFNA